MEDDNQQKQESNGEMDRFSRFMFRNSNNREAYKVVEDNSLEWPKQKEHRSSGRRTNQMDNWIFGFRRKEPETRTQAIQNKIENILNIVDYEKLMETIDMCVDTSKQLKPLFKEVSPFLDRFSKKFKSNKDA